MIDFFSNPFLQTALIVILLSSVASGIVGSYVVTRRIVFISGSISHAVLGGIGIFVYLSAITQLKIFSPLLGALLSAIFFAYLIGHIHFNLREREDTIIAAIWSLGMAVGVLFISLLPANSPELLHFLFGNILWASSKDVLMLLVFDLLIIAIALVCHKKFLALCFDETQCHLQKQPVTFLSFVLLSLVAITVVMLIQTVGAILNLAFLCLPAAIANRFTTSLSKMMIISTILSLIFGLVGILLSYSFNWPPGATIALVSTIAYLATLPIKQTI